MTVEWICLNFWTQREQTAEQKNKQKKEQNKQLS